jgi:hypothetical protein
MNPGRMNQIQ